jgi:hypothetical protein
VFAERHQLEGVACDLSALAALELGLAGESLDEHLLIWADAINIAVGTAREPQSARRALDAQLSRERREHDRLGVALVGGVAGMCHCVNRSGGSAGLRAR